MGFSTMQFLALRYFFIDQWTSHKLADHFFANPLPKRTVLVGEKLRIKFIAVVNYECNYDA